MKTRRATACFWCDAAGVPLTDDHVVPLSYGGESAASNIVRACHACNGERNRISHALLYVFQSARHVQKVRRKAAKNLAKVKPLVPVWAARERERFGRSVSDKLGTPAIPFPSGTVGRAAEEAALRAARKRAEAGKTQGEAA